MAGELAGFQAIVVLSLSAFSTSAQFRGGHGGSPATYEVLDVNKAMQKFAQAVLDASSFGQTYKQYVGGLKELNVDLGGLYNPAGVANPITTDQIGQGDLLRNITNSVNLWAGICLNRGLSGGVLNGITAVTAASATNPYVIAQFLVPSFTIDTGVGGLSTFQSNLVLVGQPSIVIS